MVVPSGALHGVRNTDKRAARLIVVAAGLNESFFEDAGAAPDLSQLAVLTTDVELERLI